MKAEELFVGAIVRVNRDGLCIKKDTIVDVRGVDADDKLIEKRLIGSTHCRPLDDNQFEGGIWCDYLDPIPLTAEILEKNGFKIDKNEAYCKRYFFACNLGKVPHTAVEFAFYGEGVSADTLFKCWTKPESCDGKNSIHICDLKFVHELQHALRLCGISKEITI